MMQSFNQWIKQFGYHWAEGQEQMEKGILNYGQARDIAQYYIGKGALISD